MTDHEQTLLTKYDLLFESRLSKVEANMDNIADMCKELKSDMRWMLVTMIGFSGIILSLMAKGFHWL